MKLNTTTSIVTSICIACVAISAIVWLALNNAFPHWAENEDSGD